MKKLLLIALLLQVATLAQADVLITEAMPNPAAVGDYDGEWFEIVNNGITAVDLNGYTFRDDGSDSFVIGVSFLIMPGEYLVLGRNADFSVNGGVVVDYEYTGYNLANGSDEIIIEDAAGALVDELWYTSSTVGASMFLNDEGGWSGETTTYGDGDFGTPGEASTGGVVSTERLSMDSIKALFR